MKFATNSDNGVTNTTSSVILTLMTAINPIVPKIVTMPVNSCVNPINSPSATCSASTATRLRISPCGIVSIKRKGTFCSRSNALTRMPRTVR